MDIQNKTYVVVGLGQSGLASATFLAQHGARVIATDQAQAHELNIDQKQLTKMGIILKLGGHSPDIFSHVDGIVISPGVPETIPPLQRARAQGIPIMGEIELAGQFVQTPIIAVTGTNGKTTTTTLISEMLKASDLKVFTGGNIGNPLINLVSNKEEVDIVVLELSSFQLDTIHSFRPQIGVLLNISADHLDRYSSLQAYAESKARLFINQGTNDIAIINGNDPLVMQVCQSVTSKKVAFFSQKKLFKNRPRAYINRNHIEINGLKTTSEKSTSNQGSLNIDLTQTRLPGQHNRENIAAAALAVLSAGCSIETIQTVVKQFKGLAHRIEYVATKKSVAFYDDSKATNVDAVVRAVEAFDQPVTLIMGGRDKGGEYDPLGNLGSKKIKHIIALGEAKNKIEATFKSHLPVTLVDSMATAVKRAYQIASKDEIVLLSPACASFDMYASYAERGQDFKNEVNRLG